MTDDGKVGCDDGALGDQYEKLQGMGRQRGRNGGRWEAEGPRGTEGHRG